MNIMVVDQQGYEVTWAGPGSMMRAKTYVAIDPRSGEPVLVAMLDPSEPVVPVPFAVQQEFQR